MALIQTPHRFRSKRQLWTYSGLGLETRDSGEYHLVKGQVRRKKQVWIRGLNKDYNHDLKGLFKAAAIRASVLPGPFQDFYHSACQLRKPIDVVATKLKMQLKWNHARPAAGPEGRKPKRNGSHNEQGLEVKDALSPSGRGRKMSLTALIDQAFTLKTPGQGVNERNRDARLAGWL